MLSQKTYEVTGTYTVTHTVEIEARTPEEAEAIYESEYAADFEKDLPDTAEADLDFAEAMPTDEEAE